MKLDSFTTDLVLRATLADSNRRAPPSSGARPRHRLGPKDQRDRPLQPVGRGTWARRLATSSRWCAEPGRVERSGAPHSSDVLREEVIDEGLVAQPSPFGLTPDRTEYLGVDPNGDQSPRRRPQGGPPHSSPGQLGSPLHTPPLTRPASRATSLSRGVGARLLVAERLPGG